ncbi:hypothetical protein COT98_00010 [Candidatus Falkowbacteria bacterium CG10_big_fil_rev_8_21_14_0_10_39_9]|uniref:Uncharacterized protein n=1 Tax=Candidatus Falkowbacteria bacterium CG10_big_fil_rev_8_21_14_0_10_39_9 TaxID=1974566 RepID=A0A2M6WRF4_9BACT|nr:MAG: hypothetical protein COT98_00010 [Candidatus Falkowbacteria bacterium CG10_big_fil_rev_8_21_14_0_10_39_9]
MKKPLKKDRSETTPGCSEQKPIPTGMIIICGDQEITIKREFIPGFGYEVGVNKKKKPLEYKTFHQVINHDLPKKKKGNGSESEVFLIGPDPVRMGKSLASKFEVFMKDNGLIKGRYQVKNVIKTK